MKTALLVIGIILVAIFLIFLVEKYVPDGEEKIPVEKEDLKPVGMAERVTETSKNTEAMKINRDINQIGEVSHGE